jgi:hypothetical protein
VTPLVDDLLPRAYRRTAKVIVLLVLVVLIVAACGESDEPRSQKQELPTIVAEKRDAIVDAAHAMDYDRLASLLDPAKFSYSFGESGNPIGYWRRLERESHVPVIGDYLPVLLGGPFGRRGNIYVWPSVYGKKPARWTPAERRWLRNNFYDEGQIRAFERAGDYLGYRVGIREDGTWLFFVAGD